MLSGRMGALDELEPYYGDLAPMLEGDLHFQVLPCERQFKQAAEFQI